MGRVIHDNDRSERKEAAMKSPDYIRAGFIVAALLSAHADAKPTPPVIPLNQELTAVEYIEEGRQTGCALRITADAGNDVLLNILLSVFAGETEGPFGMFQVIAQKTTVKDSSPLLQDEKNDKASKGRILRAWLKTASGLRLLPNKNAESSQGEGYMTSTEFIHTLKLMSAIMKEKFRIGLGREAGQPDDVFEFNQRITPDEAGNLSACMNNLSALIEEKINGGSF